MAGQRICLYRYESLSDDNDPSPLLTYLNLNHDHAVKLSFEASVSSGHNLVIEEVKYPEVTDAGDKTKRT